MRGDKSQGYGAITDSSKRQKKKNPMGFPKWGRKKKKKKKKTLMRPSIQKTGAKKTPPLSANSGPISLGKNESLGNSKKGKCSLNKQTKPWAQTKKSDKDFGHV